MAISKLSSVFIMNCSNLPVSPVREDFECCSLWFFFSLVLSITAPLNKSKNDFHSMYPPEKQAKLFARLLKISFCGGVKIK